MVLSSLISTERVVLVTGTFLIVLLAKRGYTIIHNQYIASPLTSQQSAATSKPGATELEALETNAPLSVNYFPSRRCNYTCGFCFHTDTSPFILPDDQVKKGLRLLQEAGMRKLNIAGGEPFLNPRLIGRIVKYCKEDLKIESVSIISNGSKISESWMERYAQYLDILAISCDSFHADTNRSIGRGDGEGNVDRLFKIAGWCKKYDVKFKLNTVVNKYNWNEDMTTEIEKLRPFRWKVFQCLIVAGENDNETRKRDARKFLVTDEQWRTFCDRHKHLDCYVPEDNEVMASSYLNLDERMCFLDKGEGQLKKSRSILEVGVKAAMEEVVWDKQAFKARGGIYDWTKQGEGCGSGGNKELEF